MFRKTTNTKIGTFIAVLLISFLAFVSPAYAFGKTSPASKAYYGYVFEDIKSTIYLPEDWIYMVEYNTESSHVFMGPNYESELNLYYIDLGGEDPGITPGYFLQLINSDSAESGSTVRYLSSIDSMKFGIYDGAYCVIQVTSGQGAARILLEVVYITDTHLVGLTIFDTPNTFYNNLETYETILGSLAVGPKGGTTIAANLNTYAERAATNWITNGYFHSDKSGRTQDIRITGSKWRINYIIPQGQMLLRIYDVTTGQMVESYFLTSTGTVEIKAGAGTYYMEISHSSTEAWTLQVEELMN